MKCIKISTGDAEDRLIKYIKECDGDELARLMGDCFGGQCFEDLETKTANFSFEPNEFYRGEFDYLINAN